MKEITPCEDTEPSDTDNPQPSGFLPEKTSCPRLPPLPCPPFPFPPPQCPHRRVVFALVRSQLGAY